MTNQNRGRRYIKWRYINKYRKKREGVDEEIIRRIGDYISWNY